MKIGKIILNAILLAVSLWQCFQSRQENHNFIIQINNISKLNKDSLKGYDDFFLYSIDFNLTNYTDSTIHFWMFDCSWYYNFICNVKGVYVFKPVECDHNSPAVFTIEKNQSMNFKGIIGTKDSSNLKLDLKLGFIYIKEKERSHLYEIEPPPPVDSLIRKHETHRNVIWSETFKIEKFLVNERKPRDRERLNHMIEAIDNIFDFVTNAN